MTVTSKLTSMREVIGAAAPNSSHDASARGGWAASARGASGQRRPTLAGGSPAVDGDGDSGHRRDLLLKVEMGPKRGPRSHPFI